MRLDPVLAGIGRAIGKPPGWERLVRRVAPPRAFADGARQRLMPEGYRFAVDRGTLLGWSVHLFGTYEPEVREQIARLLRPGDVAIDVGANVGWHALLMAHLVGPSGRVLAFEPNPTTRERLAAGVRSNGFTQLVIDPRAAADRPGSRGFTAPPAGEVWDGTGRLVVNGLPQHRIACTTIDGCASERSLTRVTLIKIDVEGWELSVLRGATRVLNDCRPVVLFEYDPAYISRCDSTAEELTQLLRECGYQLWLLDPRRRRRPIAALGARGGNFMATPRERA